MTCTENLRSSAREVSIVFGAIQYRRIYLSKSGTNLVEETELGSEASMSDLMEMVDLHMLHSASGLQHLRLGRSCLFSSLSALNCSWTTQMVDHHDLPKDSYSKGRFRKLHKAWIAFVSCNNRLAESPTNFIISLCFPNYRRSLSTFARYLGRHSKRYTRRMAGGGMSNHGSDQIRSA